MPRIVYLSGAIFIQIKKSEASFSLRYMAMHGCFLTSTCCKNKQQSSTAFSDEINSYPAEQT